MARLSSCQQKWMPWIGYRPVTSTVFTFSLLSMVMAICILLPRRKATKWSISSSLRSGTRPGPGKLSARFSLTILLPWKAQAQLRTPPISPPRRVAIPNCKGFWAGRTENEQNSQTAWLIKLPPHCKGSAILQRCV